ncbi:mucin-like protein [Anneissia japonica]|uniref:mucin-like protein n=1 Tax=Anneissia japonica TaxID=1529436 RepID=UPI00142583C7|nr:mucin-like protein [Anneissia japonica]
MLPVNFSICSDQVNLESNTTPRYLNDSLNRYPCPLARLCARRVGAPNRVLSSTGTWSASGVARAARLSLVRFVRAGPRLSLRSALDWAAQADAPSQSLLQAASGVVAVPDDSPPPLEAVCGIPDSENSYFDPFKYRYKSGENVTYTCYPGYTLFGDATNTCNESKWINDPPKCYQDCKDVSPPSNGDVEPTRQINHNQTVLFSCKAGYELVGNQILSCQDGHYNGSTRPICLDINECESSPCLNGGTCNDEIAHFTCRCSAQWNGTNCATDIDECAMGTDECHVSASCENTNGSYNCMCNKGYYGNGINCYEYVFFEFDQNNSSSLRENYDKKNDSELISATFRPPFGFPYGSKFYQEIYFTENGVIVFSEGNANKIGFPNAYASGFTGDSSQAMIVAPFWTDVDLTKSYGDVFYQVHDTYDSVIKDANQRIRTNFSHLQFNGTWMLVVTWYKVPQYSAEFTYEQPNTFQAALITDGIYGIIFFNFEETRMQWDTSIIINKNLIIGFNRDDKFENIQLEEPYKPDIVNGNTNLKGRWIYRSENNTDQTVNPKMECWAWYNRQPDPITWQKNLGSCPCGFGQASGDLKFSPSNDTVSLNNEQYEDSLIDSLNKHMKNAICMRTTLTNINGAGLQCCYREDFSLIEGFDEVQTSSFMLRHQFQPAFGVDSDQYDRYLKEDLIPRYYCCDASQDQSFCDMYIEKRPLGKCDGYFPPKTGWMFGDPHLQTLDGVEFTFNGLGEYILVDVDDQFIIVQGRTEKFQDFNATIFTAFVAQHNGSTKFQISLKENNTFDILLNETDKINRTVLSVGPYIPPEDPGFSVKLVSSNTSESVEALWSSGFAISVTPSIDMFNILVSIPESFKNKTKGLLGIWNGDKSDDFSFPNGTILPVNSSNENEIFRYGETWRTSPNSSLFYYIPNQSWSAFNDVKFLPVFLEDLPVNLFAANNRSIYDICGSDSSCSYDILVTNNEELAKSTKATNSNNKDAAEKLANFPPIFNDVPQQLNVTVNQLFSYNISAEDEEEGNVYYSLLTDSNDPYINESTGLFTWTPVDTSMTQIAFVASDENSATTTHQPNVFICDCKNEGKCIFDKPRPESNVAVDKFAIVECDCTPGYTGSDCRTDYDACEDNVCYPGVTCVDEPPPSETATCSKCPTGLEGDGFKCFDIDECQNNKTICQQNCRNLVPGYECYCCNGYRLQQLDGNSICIDVDECLPNNEHNCSNNAVCNNTIGSYNCMCKTGYEGDGITCRDINECNTEPCNEKAVCENNDGSYMCTCLTGYYNVGPDKCQDIDECTTIADACDVNAKCTNTEGSYDCDCNEGFSVNGIHCDDINECSLSRHNCNKNANCSNTEGGYRCKCIEGFEGDGRICNKINVCDTKECPEYSTCSEDLEDCICRDGFYSSFTANGTDTCKDVDECSNNATLCWPNSTCRNGPGTFECVCNSGFIKDGETCQDIDECLLEISDCIQECTNTAPGYNCSCADGFKLEQDNVTCALSLIHISAPRLTSKLFN